MARDFNIHELELCGENEETPRHLRTALAHELFQGATLDVFVGNEHYRVNNCHAWLNPKGLVFSHIQKPQVLHFVQSQWVSTLKRDFPVQFPAGSHFQLMHGSDRKVILYAFTQGRHHDKPVRVVLYPRGRPPTADSKSIVGWRDDINPVLNGNFRPYIVS